MMLSVTSVSRKHKEQSQLQYIMCEKAKKDDIDQFKKTNNMLHWETMKMVWERI
jgi:hypothetical protein